MTISYTAPDGSTLTWSTPLWSILIVVGRYVRETHPFTTAEWFALSAADRNEHMQEALREKGLPFFVEKARSPEGAIVAVEPS